MPLVVFRYGSFVVHIGDHLRSNLGIICSLGIICARGSSLAQFGDHLRSGDHLRNSRAYMIFSKKSIVMSLIENRGAYTTVILSNK